MPALSTATFRSNYRHSCLWSSWIRTCLRPVLLSAMFKLIRFGLATGLEWKRLSSATYLLLSCLRMIRRHPYVPPHCVVLNVLVTFSSSVVRIFKDTEVGCPIISVKAASPNVVFTIEVIDAVVLLRTYDLFWPLELASDQIFGLAFLRGYFWIDYCLFQELFDIWL